MGRFTYLYHCRNDILMKKRLGLLTTRVKYGPHYTTHGSGSARYLKGQHFGENGEPDFPDDSYVRLAPEELAARRLRPGQVILAGKGLRHFAWAYQEAFGPAVASSSFYVLTLHTELILPDYCSMILNTAPRVRALERMAIGTSVPVIPKRELLDLELPVPSLERQAQLVTLDNLQRRRRGLYHELAQRQYELDRAALTQLLQA